MTTTQTTYDVAINVFIHAADWDRRSLRRCSKRHAQSAHQQRSTIISLRKHTHTSTGNSIRILYNATCAHVCTCMLECGACLCAGALGNGNMELLWQPNTTFVDSVHCITNLSGIKLKFPYPSQCAYMIWPHIPYIREQIRFPTQIVPMFRYADVSESKYTYHEDGCHAECTEWIR